MRGCPETDEDRQGFKRSRPAWCASCGQATDGRSCTNQWCRRFDREWSVVYSVDLHQGALRQAIVGYKYRDEKGRAPALAGLLVRYLREHHTWFEEYDLLTSVPSFTGSGARRSWDPVGLLVSDLATEVGEGWEVRSDLVTKTAETEAMSGRTRWDRQRIAEGSLRRSLRCGPIDVSGARILVVDDVFTEGSTLREIARTLRLAGADEVAGLVLARPPLARASVARPPLTRPSLTRPSLAGGGGHLRR